jgi:hypothetical protein
MARRLILDVLNRHNGFKMEVGSPLLVGFLHIKGKVAGSVVEVVGI